MSQLNRGNFYPTILFSKQSLQMRENTGKRAINWLQVTKNKIIVYRCKVKAIFFYSIQIRSLLNVGDYVAQSGLKS